MMHCSRLKMGRWHRKQLTTAWVEDAGGTSQSSLCCVCGWDRRGGGVKWHLEHDYRYEISSLSRGPFEAENACSGACLTAERPANA